jgi:hypothetical protein
MAILSRLCGGVHLCRRYLAQPPLYVRAPLQSRFGLELAQSRHSRHSSPDPVPDRGARGRIPRWRPHGSKSSSRALRANRRTDVRSMAAGLSAFAPTLQAGQAGRAARYVRYAADTADHGRPALCFRRGVGWFVHPTIAVAVFIFMVAYHAWTSQGIHFRSRIGSAVPERQENDGA